MRTVDIRRTFLNFFTDRDHQVVPSSSLVTDDPTMLFTTAGMVQFKPYFLRLSTPPATRLTSAQKCVRTVDIEGIGHTDRHTTFFEMLGNFSFGSYGPDEVVPWAYEFLTERLGLDPGRLWATVYRDDDETPARWQRIGIPPERIQRLGMADNYWSTGGPGPCGPCTEIFYDRGPEFGRDGGPAADPDRFLEVWNLVFMRHVRGEGGTDDDFPIVGDLPQACVESGLGVERAAVVLQDVPHIHRTDALLPVLSSVLGQASGSRTRSPELSARIVVDHVRAASFLLADGVLPGPDGRGYVLRRLVRRAVRHARLLGVESPVLADLADQVVDTHMESWPELSGHRALVRQAIAHEEEAFGRTLTHGTRLLDTAIRRARAESGTPEPSGPSGSLEPARTAGSSGRRPALSGRTAFELHDTYGFPVDLTVEVAAEAGLTVDTDRFAALMEHQRERARQARTSASGDVDVPYRALAERHGPTRFVGYDRHQADGTVLALVRDGRELAVATEGERCTLVLDRTPMYAESGGQVGDTGTIRVASGSGSPGPDGDTSLRVLDTRRGPAACTCTRSRWSTANSGRVSRLSRPSTCGAGRRPRVRTARRTCCTRFSGSTSAATRASRALWWRRDGCGSTCRTSRRWTPTRCARSRTGSTSGCWPIPRCACGRPARPRRGPRVRSRCSARRTARWSGSSTSATSPESCAAARTSGTRARRGRYGSWESPPSVPGYAGWRR